jgi:hypothetical protein
MTLHEQSTKDLKRQVADGSLSPKKEARAEAVLRHRRAEHIRDWLGRHAWMGASSRAVRFGTVFVAWTNLTTAAFG